MENLRSILQYPMAEVQEQLNLFVHSADGYENKLKLYFALLTIISESSALMRTIDINDFLEKVRNLLDDVNSEKSELAREYHIQFFQDKEIATVLADNGAGHLLELQQSVSKALDEFERLLRTIVQTREQLPIGKQMEQENG